MSEVKKESVKGTVNVSLAKKVEDCARSVAGTEYQLVAVLAAAMTRKVKPLTVRDVQATIEAGLASGGKLANIKPAYAQDFPLVVELFAVRGGREASLSALFALAKDMRAAKNNEGKAQGTRGAHEQAIAAQESLTIEQVREATPKREVKTNGSRGGKVTTTSLDSILGELLGFLDVAAVEHVNGKQALLIESVVERLTALSVSA